VRTKNTRCCFGGCQPSVWVSGNQQTDRTAGTGGTVCGVKKGTLEREDRQRLVTIFNRGSKTRKGGNRYSFRRGSRVLVHGTSTPICRAHCIGGKTILVFVFESQVSSSLAWFLWRTVPSWLWLAARICKLHDMMENAKCWPVSCRHD
jgi:hypothetical protein